LILTFYLHQRRTGFCAHRRLTFLLRTSGFEDLSLSSRKPILQHSVPERRGLRSVTTAGEASRSMKSSATINLTRDLPDRSPLPKRQYSPSTGVPARRILVRESAPSG